MVSLSSHWHTDTLLMLGKGKWLWL